MKTVRDLLGDRRDIYALPEDATVHQAAKYLRDRKVRATAICDGEGRPLGVISQRVREIMSTQLITVTRENGLEECLRLMEKNNIYHLLVLDESGLSLGMISVQDVFRMVASDEKARADLLESWAFASF